MPPRRSARVVAAAAAAAAPACDANDERSSSPPRHNGGACAFATLPHVLTLKVFALVTVDTRLRCAEVSTVWRAELAERSLWTRLNFSAAAAGLSRAATDAMLRAAALRAGGALEALDVSGCDGVTLAALRAVVAANVGTLTELRTNVLTMQQAEALCRAAPTLRLLDTAVSCNIMDASGRMLRNEPPFAPLRVRSLSVQNDWRSTNEVLLALAANLAGHAALKELHLERVALRLLPAFLDAIVDAAGTTLPSFSSLVLSSCAVSDVNAAALSRLLDITTFQTLKIATRTFFFGEPGAGALLLCDALRANSTLTTLHLTNYDASIATQLLSALTGHASVRDLRFSCYGIRATSTVTADAIGAALSMLVAANAPALRRLHVAGVVYGPRAHNCALLAPLLAALSRNTHLRVLDCAEFDTTHAFARDVLLPAVRANTSLRSCASRTRISTT
jgi:hypothetical protein